MDICSLDSKLGCRNPQCQQERMKKTEKAAATEAVEKGAEMAVAEAD